MSKIKILVACHKPGKVYQDDIYTPIHVGRAVSGYKEEMAGMIGDDTGDNISEKNPRYCELTAQYWAWKNLHDVDYIGFCHYRRYFNLESTECQLTDMLKHKDVIALKIVFPFPMYWEIMRYISMEHLVIMMMVVKKKYPDYEQTMIDYLRGNVLYAKNMFICKKELFDQYAEWLFDILSECEKHMKPVPYSRLERSLAYMGEYLMPVYMMYHHKKMAFVDYCGNHEFVRHSWRWRAYIIRRHCWCHVIHRAYMVIFRRNRSLESYYQEAVLVGFKQDQIEI